MPTKKLENYEANEQIKSLCRLYLKKGEKRRLYDICINYDIPITYPNLFEDDKHYYLWGIRKTGIGLISTHIMNFIENNNGTIFHSLNELEEYLKK